MFNDAKLINYIANMLSMLAMVLLLISFAFWLAKRPYFTINAITIEPLESRQLHYVSPIMVSSVISSKELSGNFFFMDLEKTKSILETTPWVRKAYVQRVWPNGLRVKLEEHQPFAFWNKDLMLNTWGEIFDANQGQLLNYQELPFLYGPEASQKLMVQRYGEVEHLLAPLNAKVIQLSLSPRYAWDLTLNNGVTLSLGRDPSADDADLHGRSGATLFAEKIKRFVQAWPELNTRLGQRQLKTADLRYSDGFAITLAPALDEVAN